MHTAGAPRPVLVELFTSEGCSSCPPADALLRKLDGTRTAQGQLIVGISEHVTYWNNLGWADPYSNDVYTQRQYAYGRHFGGEGVYTPQMVVNGVSQMVGSDSGAVLRAVRAEDRASAIDLRIVSMKHAGSGQDGKLTVTYTVSGEMNGRGADIYAVIADDSAASNVARGENSGRLLTHVSVARSMSRVALVKNAGTMTVALEGPSTSISAGPQHLILFAQAPGQGRVYAVDSKPIEDAR